MRAMKILHLLSQRPEATGSGAALQAILLESERAGHENLLVAGIPKDTTPSLPPLSRTTRRRRDRVNAMRSFRPRRSCR